MQSLTPEHLEFLRRYGFDESLFESWRRGVRDGTYSLAANALAGEILAPETEAIEILPLAGSAEAAELELLGGEAIARGELGVVILNGGMATRLGGIVKGTMEVLPGRSFLALNIGDARQASQRHGGPVSVFLMNSFATEQATHTHLAEHDRFGLPADLISSFNQLVSVRMTPGGDIFETADGDISPHGPGHGDFAPTFRESRCLQRFLERGGRHLLVSNIDNLGARISARVLGHHIRSQAEVTVEVAPKWPGDVGGAPYVVDGKLQLVEQVRFPADFDPDIVDVFNTNTFCFAAEALDRDFDLTWCYIAKEVDGRPAVQIERLIGEMTRFLDSNFVKVKRTGSENRFLPVKTPEDLEGARDEILDMYGA